MTIEEKTQWRSLIFRLKKLIHAAWLTDNEFVMIKRGDLERVLNKLKKEVKEAP